MGIETTGIQLLCPPHHILNQQYNQNTDPDIQRRMLFLPKLDPSGSTINVGCNPHSCLPQDWGVSNQQSLLYSQLKLTEISVNLLAKIFPGSCECSHKPQNSNVVTSDCFCQYICSADGETDRILVLPTLPSLMSLCSVD